LWLQARHAGRLHVALHDVRDQSAVGDAVADAGAVFHLAAQVAVTSSLLEPLHDFAVNLQGTLTLLESMRRHAPDIPLLFASTNKVYGPLDDIAVELDHDRHLPRDPQLRARGIDETQRLAFCTPYGCSKGAADQYVLDYANSFGLRAAVLRMSCIYGPRQFGTEDQGWVAHFLFRALQDEPITIYGDGKQVRDILHVQDAVAAYRAALRHIDVVAGRAFNLGGGPANAVSLVMVLQEIEALIGSEVTLLRADTRKGDQPYFVADTTALENALGWHAKVGWQEGLHNLAQWVQSDLGIQVLPKRARETRVRA
jgi:CDP-paratose 2-epimerase